MSYFNKVKENEKVFGLVFGKGSIRSVWKDSYYTFEVEYENGQVVPYTSDGNPAWNTGRLDFQTVFYKEDIDLCDIDFTPVNKDNVLSAKKIIKLRNNKKLEVKCPSGVWQEISNCPPQLISEYLEDKKFDLFRKLEKRISNGY